MAKRNSRQNSTGATDLMSPDDYLTPDGSVKPRFVVEGSFAEQANASYNRTSGTGSGARSSSKSKLSAMLNNIDDGITPWSSDGGDCISIKDAVILCQKAYWNVSIFRLSIDVMTEFANSKLHFKSTNKQAVKFFNRWWYDRVNGWRIGDQFFREWFRSGNVFLYRLDGVLDIAEFRKLKTASAAAPVSAPIPLRYLVLNPADMHCCGAASFLDATYDKALNSYESARLKNPKTAEEKEFKKSLPPKTQKALTKGGQATLELDQEKLSAIFCKKQDYEPLAVPMYFPVLFDINLKMQLKKAESVIARTTDYIILLIKMGAKAADLGDKPYDPALMVATQSLFQNESVGRVLVADWTTSAEFVIPDLNKILGPEKYTVVNRDISDGLMNIFFSEAKFADSMIKTKMFLERLNEARRAFLELFLKPEMKRIAKDLGFRDIPDVEFEEIDLKDEVEYMRIYTRLAELGLLTGEETFEVMKSHQLPTAEDSVTSQAEFKKLKDKGYYEPLTGSKVSAENGRPSGTKAPQTTKKVKPAGASVRQFSSTTLAEVVNDSQKLLNSAEACYKKKHGIQRLSKKHKAVAHDLAELVICNELRENWERGVAEYIDGNFKPNLEMSATLSEIAAEHQVSDLMAALLLHSEIKDN